MGDSRKILLSLAVVLLLTVFFRFYDIKNLPPGLYPDEAMNGNNALEAIKTGEYKIFYPENNGREGLFINIQGFFLKVLMPIAGSPEPWMLRIPSAIFGTLTVLGIYFLSRELFSLSPLAIFSTFFATISFWHINFSRIGFRAIMAPFFITWALYFLIKSLNSGSLPKTGPYLLYAFLGGLFLGGGVNSYIAYRIMPILILFSIALYAKKCGWRGTLKITAAVMLGALLTALPLTIYFLNHPSDFFGRTGQVSIFGSNNPLGNLGLNIFKTAGQFNFFGDKNWRHNIAGEPLLSWPAGIFFLVGIITGMASLKKYPNSIENPQWDQNEKNTKIRKGFLILAAWLVVAALPVVISNEGIPHALRSILMIPPVFILTGLGAYLFLKLVYSRLPKKLFLIFGFFSAIIIITLAYNDYFIRWGKNPEVQGAFAANYVAIGKEINALPPEIPKYILVEANGVPVRGTPMPAQTIMFVTDSFREESRRGKNIFYVAGGSSTTAPANAKVFRIR